MVIAAERALDLRREFLGVDHPVPVIDGRLVPYVNLDNAASTPALRSVVETVEEFLPFYASVHRGTGYMSRLSTAAYGAPGMVRVSLGAYNDVAEVDRAVRALGWLVAGEVLGTYRMLDDGTFVAEGYDEPLLFDVRPDPPAPSPGGHRPGDRRVPAGVSG